MMAPLAEASESAVQAAGWTSMLPAVVAIVLALIIRSVIPALFIGIWIGASLLRGGSPLDYATGLLDTLQVHVVGAVADADHAAILVFTLMMGGMIGIIIRNGGMHQVLAMVLGVARGRRGAQASVSGMGLLIFFDDYANTMVVGNSARTLTDHFRISRQKLAYIVDSTAAPMAAIAVITTWIGYQVSLVDDAILNLEGFGEMSAYSIFLQSIVYSFYPILAIVFVLLVAVSGRDFGPMLTAERDAVMHGAKGPDAAADEALEPHDEVTGAAWLALVPIAVMVATLAGGLLATGEGDTLIDIIGSADAYKAMVWASLTGVMSAALLTLLRGEMGLEQTISAWYVGVRSVLLGALVLVLAWSLSGVTGELGASDFLVGAIGDGLALQWLPAIVFLVAAFTAFGTGTSWGTMAVLTPLVIPLCWALMVSQGMQGDMSLLYSVIACVMSGAVWGDHCSPISDTTVLSSVASGCDLVEHIRTQLPYALLVGGVALFLGTVPSAFGLSPLLCLVVGAIVLGFVLKLLGRTATGKEPASGQARASGESA